ncbi:MAG: hypothetical protein GY913_30395, partial [Proteobacteria bacterium]|nr:hypothetical protein [Pseudomonadota bacterium]
WEDKATSCRRIASELNVGLDSLVFFDDNPVERAWVAEACPEVLVVDVPADAARYVQTLQALHCFETATLSREDTERTSLYRANAARSAVRAEAPSLEDYLASLGTELELGEADATTLPRIAQLVGKSNQLNMTTRRRTESELADLVASATHRVFWARVRDRFGDSGLVGVAIARCEDQTWELDTFLLSCRVIKR